MCIAIVNVLLLQAEGDLVIKCVTYGLVGKIDDLQSTQQRAQSLVHESD